MKAVVLLTLTLVTRIASAGEHDATFAKNFRVAESAVRDVSGYVLPPGGDTTHVLIGRYESGNYVMAGAVLLACDGKTCSGRRTEYGAADKIEVHGVVDLHGTPRPLPDRAIRSRDRWTKVGARGMKFPVLVIRTTESKQATGETRDRRPITGRKRRSKLYVISLVESDRGSTVLQDTAEERGPTGRGMSRTYRLEKGDVKGALDIIATEQRHLESKSRCVRPAPTEQRFTLDGRHYGSKSYRPKRGC